MHISSREKERKLVITKAGYALQTPPRVAHASQSRENARVRELDLCKKIWVCVNFLVRIPCQFGVFVAQVQN